MDKPDSSGSKDRISARSSGIEEQILRAQKKKEERAFLEELAKRISIAREGKMLAEKKDYAGAITAYRRFLEITARSLSVEVKDLQPNLFEEKSRNGESLLISSIVFDAIKILDKLSTPSSADERKMLHKLFVRFVIGQNFQSFAAENVRKFVTYRKSVRHKAEFWATYQAVRIKRYCLIASWAFAGHTGHEVKELRQFRDRVLSRSKFGRAFVEFYYQRGHRALAVVEMIPGSRPVLRLLFRGLTKFLGGH